MQADELRLFLASPGGLEGYRRAARECAEQVRQALARPQGVGFELVGWEDVRPGYGRPQGVINPSLDDCNVLVGILGNRLGTPTGEADSGFVEEFERMAERARAGQDVEILIYTTQLADAELEDPGEKLRRVIEFRERLGREVLYKEVRNPDDFRVQLTVDLMGLVAEAAARRGPAGEEVSVPAQDAGAPPAASAEAGGEDAAAAQLRGLFAEAGSAAPEVPERFRSERFPLARIALWLSSWQGWLLNNETFGVHELNQVYKGRADAALGALERRQILRTVCAEPAVAPGWALLDPELGDYVAQLIALAMGDGEDAVRVGAFALIDGNGLDEWVAREDVELDRRVIFERLTDRAEDGSERLRAAMIEFAVRVGGKDARAFLDALVDRDIASQSALEGGIRLEATTDLPGALTLAADAEAELGESTLLALREAAAGAEIEQLEAIAVGRTEGVRLLAAELLATRGEEAAGALRALLDDAEDAVALTAFAGLVDLPGPGIDPAEVGDRLAEREGLRFDEDLRLLRARGRPVAELRGEISWVHPRTAGCYRALAEEHFAEFGEVVRRDLEDDFETFAAESRERELTKLEPKLRDAIVDPSIKVLTPSGDEDTAKVLADYRSFIEGGEWNLRLFTVAALAGVAAAGEAADAALVRGRLGAEDARVREAAVAALARVGGEEDLGPLLELAQTRAGEHFALAAIAISPGPRGAARALLDTSRTATGLAAARHLHSQARDLDEETVEQLLHHPIDQVRRVGVAIARARAGEDDQALQELLERYLEGTTYFYNVVALLDRLLHAPVALRERTRTELADFATEERPTPLAGVGREAPLMRAIRKGVG